MPAVDPLYDLVLMLDSAAPDEQRQKVRTGVEQIIGPIGIVNTQDWGVRQTAYEIRHKTDAEYHLLQFHGGREVLESLQRTLRIADGVVRYRIIKLKPGTPAPPSTRPEPRPTGIGEPVAPAVEPVAVAAAVPEAPADE